jgi:hypothetical protein
MEDIWEVFGISHGQVLEGDCSLAWPLLRGDLSIGRLVLFHMDV